MGMLEIIAKGGFAMYPLLLASFVTWGIVFERLLRYRRLRDELRGFHLEAMNALLQGDDAAIRKLCQTRADLPLSDLLTVALDRLRAKDARLRAKWREAVERRRQLVNSNLKKNLWMLGTIAAATPFVGLFGTVVGILRSFGEIAATGKGGFAVVSAGISEALIATAAGIVVAVIAVLAYNTFQNQWSSLVLLIRVQTEELAEVLESSSLAAAATDVATGAAEGSGVRGA